MAIKIPAFISEYQFGFYSRKFIFQVFLPILLAFMTFCDFVSQSGKKNNSYAYSHLYFYTTFVLFLYACMKYILDYIFSVCADNIVFKKEVSLIRTTPDLLLSVNLDTQNGSSNNHYFIIIKKIFKLRYSKSIFFKYIDKACLFLGIDSPILIPYEIAVKLANIKEEITKDNEDLFLQNTLANLHTYHPTKYNMVPIIDESNPADDNEALVPRVVISKLDKTISDMQKDIFNVHNDVEAVNV